jgi:hypothetical protein
LQQEKSSELYESTLEHIKQKAIGMTSPRPPIGRSWAALADFSQLPSDKPFTSTTITETEEEFSAGREDSSNLDENSVDSVSATFVKCTRCGTQVF